MVKTMYVLVDAATRKQIGYRDKLEVAETEAKRLLESEGYSIKAIHIYSRIKTLTVKVKTENIKQEKGVK